MTIFVIFLLITILNYFQRLTVLCTKSVVPSWEISFDGIIHIFQSRGIHDPRQRQFFLEHVEILRVLLTSNLYIHSLLYNTLFFFQTSGITRSSPPYDIVVQYMTICNFTHLPVFYYFPYFRSLVFFLQSP